MSVAGDAHGGGPGSGGTPAPWPRWPRSHTVALTHGNEAVTVRNGTAIALVLLLALIIVAAVIQLLRAGG